MTGNFAIFTHVEHYYSGKDFSAYEPYVREMNLWLKYVDSVTIVAPIVLERKPYDAVYHHSKIHFKKIPSINFQNINRILRSLLVLPIIIWRIFEAMYNSDHIHIRCPGNIGLLATIVQIFFPSKPKTVKYAGNWDPQSKQPYTYRVQKWILSNTFFSRNMQVLVYGEWPEQKKNVKPFFTASFTVEEKFKIGEKNFLGSLTFLFVGNLVVGKRPLEAVKLVEELNLWVKGSTDPEIRANLSRTSLEIFGDGPEREKLETYVREKQLEEFVVFKGNRPLEELKGVYQKAHFVVLPSKSEGWPKAIAEGMFFGCIPIASPVSCVPWMLNYGCRGVLLDEYQNQEPGAKSLDLLSRNIDKVELLLQDPEEMERMSEASKEWSQQYTLEKFEAAIREILF